LQIALITARQLGKELIHLSEVRKILIPHKAHSRGTALWTDVVRGGAQHVDFFFS